MMNQADIECRGLADARCPGVGRSVRLTKLVCEPTLTNMSDTTDKIPLDDVDLANEINARQESREKWDAAVQAFEQLYRRYADRMLLFLSSRLTDDELETTHRRIWEAVWENDLLPTGEGNFNDWLFEIAHREMAACRENRDDSPPTATHQETIVEMGVVDEIIDRERVALMTDCMNQLDDELADVLRRRFAGESNETISCDLDVDLVRVDEMIARGKALISVFFSRASTR